MIPKTLAATEVKNRFGRVLHEVSTSGNPIIVEKSGKPVAVIISLKDYEQIQQQALAPQPDLRDVFGMWSGREDIEEEWLTEGRRQWQSRWKDA
jgi:prevent-host-death family protein